MSDDPTYLLRNLLAVVFRDDGARTDTFPTLAAAVEEAIRVVAEGNAARDELTATGCPACVLGVGCLAHAPKVTP